MTDSVKLRPGPHTIEKSEVPSEFNAQPVSLVVCLIAAVVLAAIVLFGADDSRSSSYVYCCVTQLPYILAIAIISLFRDRVWLSFLGGIAFTTGVASVLLLIPLIVLNVRWNGFPQRHDLIPSAAAVLLVLVDAFITFASFRLRSSDTAAFIVGMVLTFFYLVGSGVFLTLYPGLAQGFASITAL